MLLASILAALLVAEAPVAAAPPPLPVMAPAQLAFAEQFDVTSKITGRTYRIYVSRPAGPPPKDGYPVLFVLDADDTFQTAASQARVSVPSGRPPLLVVGVTYPNAMAANALRGRDLTPSKPDAASRLQVPRANPEEFGDADGFHRFMMDELRPVIAQANPVNAHNQSLMGFSFGGLFVLHVLFNHPDAYQSVVAGSPSIWWNDREVLRDEAEFVQAVRAGRVAPRILITSSGWEQNGGGVLVTGKLREGVMAQMNAARMVDNARELASRLKAVKGGPGYEVRYVLFPEETHNSGGPASTSRGVAFLYGR